MALFDFARCNWRTITTSALWFASFAIFAQPAAPLALTQTIAMPGVSGRIDHLDADPAGERLFVAALGNDTVEIIDLRAGRAVARLESLREPQGVGYVPAAGQLFVANGGGGVTVFSGTPLRLAGRIDGLDDADNVRLDQDASYLYVGYGRGLAVIDPASRQIISRIPLAGHPESFQLRKTDARLFVNVPSARQVAVVDRKTQQQVATWRLGDAGGNFPMALDEPHGRLFVGTRQPPRLIVYDTDSGKSVATLPIGGDVDDLFYDSARRQIYAVCGEGVINVIKQRDANDYVPVGDIKTAPGARTGLFVAERNALYVAVPTRGSSGAEIRVFSMQ